MRKKLVGIFLAILSVAAIAVSIFLLEYNDVVVLNPKGLIGAKERDLLIFSTLIMLIVVIPVFILTFVFAWKYQEGNKKAKYTPEWDNSRLAEWIWTTIPVIIITILSVMVWYTSHELDPFKPIENGKKPLTVQVVAQDWKWFFIYPEQKIATVNYLQIPEKTPIRFDITADAPMNSFWIPQLGGQVFAMPGMDTKLHLIADTQGTFKGFSANLSGEGFAGMVFDTKATSEDAFEEWVKHVQTSAPELTIEGYKNLAKPSFNNPQAFYRLNVDRLYEWIVMKFMMPMPDPVALNSPCPGHMPDPSVTRTCDSSSAQELHSSPQEQAYGS